MKPTITPAENAASRCQLDPGHHRPATGRRIVRNLINDLVAALQLKAGTLHCPDVQEGIAAAVKIFDEGVATVCHIATHYAAMLRPWPASIVKRDAGSKYLAVAFIPCDVELHVIGVPMPVLASNLGGMKISEPPSSFLINPNFLSVWIFTTKPLGIF